MDLRTAQEQIARLKVQGCFEPMEKSAKGHNLPLAFVCAIASRETDCDNKLGDFRSGIYHGVGVMQIDIQHEIARDAVVNRTWKEDPAPLIEFGCRLLASNRYNYREIVLVDSSENRLRFAAAAYNAGFSGAVRGHDAGDCDKFTTHHNYGKDVLQRMEWFQQALKSGPRPKRKVPNS